MNTLVDIIDGECESIISCIENVYEIASDDEITTKLLNAEEFETIRYTAEELQSYVLIPASDEYDITTDGELYDLSVNLYRDVKYIVEAVEDSITQADILEQFEYIRESVDFIRSEINKAQGIE